MADDLATAGMPALLMEAAQQAAQADGVLDPQQAALQHARNAMAMAAVANARQQQQQQMQHQQQQHIQQQQQQVKASKKKGPPLRRGKWTPEEEAYAARLIQEFKAGLLPLTDGTTLRTFLSKLLNCDPMRISKKFVGSNCIGKQVFRRRTADLNRLTPEQIQQSRAELSDLERRFLERVAQTNRVKSTGCAPSATGGGGGGGGMTSPSQSLPNNPTPAPTPASQKNDLLQSLGMGGGMGGNGMGGGVPFQQSFGGNGFGQQQQQQQQQQMDAPNPPWLQPPMGYKHGTGQAFAASHLSTANARAAAAGRALLGASVSSAASTLQNASTNHLAAAAQHGGSAGLLAMAELQRRASQSSFLQSFQQQQQQQQQNTSANNLFAAAARSGSNSALEQIARTASAHRFAGQLGAANSSMNSLMMKTGLSRDQLSQLARDRVLPSTGSLGNMIQRQNSFDALMSLDFQSLQSIDNLANLIQTGGTTSNMPESGMKNADFGAMLAAASSRGDLNTDSSSGDLSNVARRLANAASSNRMDALLNSLNNSSSNNNLGREGDTSNATISNLLQSLQGTVNPFGSQGNASTASLFNAASGMGNNSGSNNSAAQSAMNFASFMHPDSSTGLSALRMQDGINQRHSSSVDDFLSLVAAGDIPHQDPNLLNVPLMQQQDAAAKLLAQQQLLQGNSALANALASRSFGNMTGPATQAANSNTSSNNLSDAQLNHSTTAAAVAMAQANASRNGGDLKRTSDFISGDQSSQGDQKR